MSFLDKMVVVFTVPIREMHSWQENCPTLMLYPFIGRPGAVWPRFSKKSSGCFHFDSDWVMHIPFSSGISGPTQTWRCLFKNLELKAHRDMGTPCPRYLSHFSPKTLRPHPERGFLTSYYQQICKAGHYQKWRMGHQRKAQEREWRMSLILDDSKTSGSFQNKVDYFQEGHVPPLAISSLTKITTWASDSREQNVESLRKTSHPSSFEQKQKPSSQTEKSVQHVLVVGSILCTIRFPEPCWVQPWRLSALLVQSCTTEIKQHHILWPLHWITHHSVGWKLPWVSWAPPEGFPKKKVKRNKTSIECKGAWGGGGGEWWCH